MAQYQPNSDRYREEQEKLPEKKVEKVITGTATQRKKSEVHKFADEFLGSDLDSVKHYVFTDVLVPAVKNALSDIITKGLDMLFYGEVRGSSTRPTGTKVSYRDYYDRQNREPARSNYVPSGRNSYSYDDIIFQSRGDAEAVLMRMDEMMAQYHVVSVADLCDLADISCNYTDYKYGWQDIRGASIVSVREGYLLKMPRAMPL